MSHRTTTTALLALVALAARGAADGRSPAGPGQDPAPVSQGVTDLRASWVQDREELRALERGLGFLAAQQRADGSFSPSDYSREKWAPVGVAALGALAFMADGNTPGRGPHGREVARSIDYLLARTDLFPGSPKYGYIEHEGDPVSPHPRARVRDTGAVAGLDGVAAGRSGCPPRGSARSGRAAYRTDAGRHGRLVVRPHPGSSPRGLDDDLRGASAPRGAERRSAGRPGRDRARGAVRPRLTGDGRPPPRPVPLPPGHGEVQPRAHGRRGLDTSIRRALRGRAAPARRRGHAQGPVRAASRARAGGLPPSTSASTSPRPSGSSTTARSTDAGGRRSAVRSSRRNARTGRGGARTTGIATRRPSTAWCSPCLGDCCRSSSAEGRTAQLRPAGTT